MNKKLTLLAVILTIVVVASAIYFAGCTKKQPMPPTLPEGYNWYHNDEFGYKIAYPESWTVVPQETMGLGEGMEHAQTFEDPDTPSRIFVTVNSEYDIEGLKTLAGMGVIISGRDVVINGREGYEAIMEPTAGLKMKIVAFLVNDKYYVLFCYTSVDLWDEYAATFDNAINSFVIE